MHQVQSICTATEMCHQGSYKLHGNLPFFQELQISIQRKSKDHYEAEKFCTFNVHGEYTQTTISLPLSAI